MRRLHRLFAGWLAATLLSVVIGGHAHADCQAPSDLATDLRAIKGNDAKPLAAGRRVAVAGTVSAVFRGPRTLGGFYLQQPGADGRPPIGVFVRQPDRVRGGRPVTAGQRILLTARTGRYRGHVQLERVERIIACGADGGLRPWSLSLPAEPRQLRRLKDVLVRIPQRLTVTSNYQLAHYGTLGLSVGGRLFQPGNGVQAPSGVPAGVLLDDGSYRANPGVVPYLDGHGTRRLGSEISDLTGILAHAFGRWRIQPGNAPRFYDTNPRVGLQPRRSGTLRVASFNLANYFVSLGARGADSSAALRRQQRKLVEAIRGLDADVLALHEVENRPQAVATLLRAVNAASAHRERYLAAAAGMEHGSGAIRTVLLYRGERLAPRQVWINDAPVFTRPPVAANLGPFDRKNAPLLVVAAHLKSKAGCSARADRDRSGGCWAGLRKRQALALSRWLERLQARTGHARILLIGDLNGYRREAALRTLLDVGLTDLIATHIAPAQRYTYVYHGEAGYLDHALASASLTEAVSQAMIWHINADEPRFLNFTNPRVGATVYRSSDHDPVIVDLR